MPLVDKALTQRPMHFSADELIPFGKYMLLNKIQSGATAAVYRAKIKGEAGFERLVAIKRILPQMAGDPEFVRTFIEEAKTCARLNHENICPIYELGKVGESLYMCMEWLPSKDLGAITRRLSRQGEVMPPLVAAWIASKLCDALDYAHSLKIGNGSIGIIHRDLSPTNIVCSYEGQVKLIDFGLAKASGRAQQTNVDALKLKLGYMSPELVLGRAPDARSDVFGVGVCLYEMITARRLFAGKDDVTTLRMVSNASVPPPSALVEDAPEELEQITMRALERAPEDRWQTAGDMSKELTHFIVSTDPKFGPRQVSEFMRTLFASDMEAEQKRVNELLKASHDPAVLEERRRFFASPAGAAAIAKAEAARRFSTLPPPARLGSKSGVDDDQPGSGRIPKAPRLPRISGGVPDPSRPPKARSSAPAPEDARAPANAVAPRGNEFEDDDPTHFHESSDAATRALFEEERTAHFDPSQGPSLPLPGRGRVNNANAGRSSSSALREEERTKFIPTDESGRLQPQSNPLPEEKTVAFIPEEKTMALSADMIEEDLEEATQIFFNLEEGIGVPDLVSVEVDMGPEALPTVLTETPNLPDMPPGSMRNDVGPLGEPRRRVVSSIRKTAGDPRDTRDHRDTPAHADWLRGQTAPEPRRAGHPTLILNRGKTTDRLSSVLLAIGIVMLLLAIAGLVTRTPVGVKLGLRTPTVASIEVRTTPAVGAAVKLDGIYRGRAPLRLEGVHSGPRVIAVEADGYQSASREVQLEGGTRQQLMIELELK